MASASSLQMTVALLLLLSLSLLLPYSAFASVICEELPQDECSFAISESSNRCVLESFQYERARKEYQCRTSEVVVEKMANWIETDECIKSCGVDRNSVGLSTDFLHEPQLTTKLCSPACYQNCPNIVDLYFNLAAGEGSFLPDLCEAQRANPHRSMLGGSWGFGEPAPAPAPSPL